MQQSTISVSKGCFVFKNATACRSTAKSTGRKKKSAAVPTSLLDSVYKSQRWYAAYARTWHGLEEQHDRLQTHGYARTLDYLRAFIAQCQTRLGTSAAAGSGGAGAVDSSESGDTNLPTVALLTGINQPDHVQLFSTFAETVRSEQRSHVCILQSMDCPNMKATVEAMVAGLMEEHHQSAAGHDMHDAADADDDEAADESADADTLEMKRLRRSQYTMAVLRSWYNFKYPPAGRGSPRPILAVIVPDFENFQRDILQQFILLLSHNCRRLPIVLVLGVATDLATLHRTLSFADMSRMSLQVSQSEPSTVCLGKILEEIVLTPNCAVQLSPKVFTLLTDIFLYYDLSINSFMQGFKYCVIEHYNQGNMYSLCTAGASKIRHAIRDLDADDLAAIRRLPSFRRYVESLINCRHVIAVLTDDGQLRSQLYGLLEDIRVWLLVWHGVLRFLLALVAELPRTQLGKQLRDLYAKCAATAINNTPDFQSAWELLAFLSRDQLLDVLTRGADGLRTYSRSYCSNTADKASVTARSEIAGIVAEIRAYIERIRDASNVKAVNNGSNKQPSTDAFKSDTKVMSRQELQAKVLEMSKQPKTSNAFSLAVRQALADIRTGVIGKHLLPFSVAPPLLELFVFDDVAAVRSHIMGAPRAALHNALLNPQSYLQCECCVISSETQMLRSLPDLSIVYKLHLESGQQINLFDWMQAFRSVVAPMRDDGDDGNDEDADGDEPISPQLQARFTRAVAELQFLGFIKSSKRKTDHVARLTW